MIFLVLRGKNTKHLQTIISFIALKTKYFTSSHNSSKSGFQLSIKTNFQLENQSNVAFFHCAPSCSFHKEVANGFKSSTKCVPAKGDPLWPLPHTYVCHRTCICVLVNKCYLNCYTTLLLLHMLHCVLYVGLVLRLTLPLRREKITSVLPPLLFDKPGIFTIVNALNQRLFFSSRTTKK